jgi:hypothetical protein
VDILRIIGTLFVLLGHWVMFNKSKKRGLALRILGGLSSLPFSVQQGYIDLVIMGIAFTILDLFEFNKTNGKYSL